MHRRHHGPQSPLIFAMVGLPARGKSYIARRLLRYMSWLGYETRVFNLGDYRRQLLPGRQGPNFFSPENMEGLKERRRIAKVAMEDVAAWFAEGGQVAIYDATNTTQARRAWVGDQAKSMGARLVFIEILTDDQSLIEGNVVEKQQYSADYTGVPAEVALEDFRARLSHYRRLYEPVAESDFSFIKLIDVGRQVIANRIQGYLPSRAVYLLMNLHLERRPILLTRHGESDYNAQGRIGGDSGLTERGRHYAEQLGEHIRGRFSGRPAPVVWTSTLCRTRETSLPLELPVSEWRGLDEIEAGICNGMTYEQIQEAYPEDFAARQANKLEYRYPRGESYMDVIERVHPIIIELERQRSPVVVVAHQAVLRVLYAYFMHRPLSQCPYLSVPLHTVIELTPTSFGCQETRSLLTVAPPQASSN